tara:strand:+ start:228 stop:1259 length:1032 start_codon:yes stop_codon:yes gene_type:complete
MKIISILQPDDWHLHLREGYMLDAVVQYSSKIFSRCIAMPNLTLPITSSKIAKDYKKEIQLKSSSKNFEAFIPCYLTDDIDLNEFSKGLKNSSFFGAKFYPINATTNSSYGISDIEKLYPALEILEENNSPLLIHGEKISPDIDIFDREKFFIDDELQNILKRFNNLKIVLEHVSSEYGADFITESGPNIAATVTIHHLTLTKKDVFNGKINPHNYCMPVVKNEQDLVSLRKHVCSGNKKFFLGTDSAPHDVKDKESTHNIKAGIFSAPVAIEMYASVFEEEDKIHNLEKFSSINGADFYDLPHNSHTIKLKKDEWINPEFTSYNGVKIKNFMGGKKINWKVV